MQTSKDPALASLFPKSHPSHTNSATHSFICQLRCEHLRQALKAEHTGGPHTVSQIPLGRPPIPKTSTNKWDVTAQGSVGGKCKTQSERPGKSPRWWTGTGAGLEGAGQGRDDKLLGGGSSRSHVLPSTRRAPCAGPTQPFIELLHLAREP